MVLYLDICCLKRPFAIRRKRVSGSRRRRLPGLLAEEPSRVTFVRSAAHDLENDQNPLAWRAERVRGWLAERPLVKPEAGPLQARTADLISRGLRGFDALHLACAEAAGADVFVTCDDRLLAVAQRLGPELKVRVGELTAAAREVFS